MRTIEATTVISEDRKLVIQLPQDVAPGEHRVVVWIDEPAKTPTEPEDAGETPTRWEGNVLVYNGTMEGPVEGLLDQIREERIRQFLKQAQP
jgi:hypothetical protein